MRTMQLPDTRTRVDHSTGDEVNQKIRQETDASVARLEGEDNEVLTNRIQELDQEWDIERTLQANASMVAGLGVALGLTVDRRFFLLPTAVFSFLLQHALQGWCPPLPAFRRLGVRTQHEIDRERYAVKMLRGDFDSLDRYRDASPSLRVNAVMEAVDL